MLRLPRLSSEPSSDCHAHRLLLTPPARYKRFASGPARINNVTETGMSRRVRHATCLHNLPSSSPHRLSPPRMSSWPHRWKPPPRTVTFARQIDDDLNQMINDIDQEQTITMFMKHQKGKVARSRAAPPPRRQLRPAPLICPLLLPAGDRRLHRERDGLGIPRPTGPQGPAGIH